MPKQFENFLHPSNAAAVTPHDDDDLSNIGILYVGTTGDVAVITAGGQTVVFTAVPAGSFLPMVVSRVKATNTTADDILVCY